MTASQESKTCVDYQTHPSLYRHWRLSINGCIATIKADFDENAGIRPGYKLKLNSYDLGVDIELHDVINRIRFEHPQVRTVIITSAKERVFCSGANIFMLGLSSHAWKVNFCKFTNETRNGLEDSSQFEGIKFLAAVNGSCAGGGYELALACDHILLIDDQSSAVSLPEVPLLGVLPGTGGLTRVTDKRQVRHDLADLFCTTSEGVRGQRALQWRLVDEIAKPGQFAQCLAQRSQELAKLSSRPQEPVQGVSLPALERVISPNTLTYSQVSVDIDRNGRTATFMIKGPQGPQPTTSDQILQLGAAWYPLVMGRELDDAVLWMRTNEPDIGTWLIKTSGLVQDTLQMDETLASQRNCWLVEQTIGLLRRTFSRLDVSSRSLFALIESNSCFAGTLLELALACDRTYMLALPSQSAKEPRVALSPMNFGSYPMATNQSRLGRLFYDHSPTLEALSQKMGQLLTPSMAHSLGLTTSTPDDIDWADETRLAIEERAAMSADALTAMEANLRFNGKENMITRIFGRLTAWQNWVFQRPNAVGEKGALKVYGKGQRAIFDLDRV